MGHQHLPYRKEPITTAEVLGTNARTILGTNGRPSPLYYVWPPLYSVRPPLYSVRPPLYSVRPPLYSVHPSLYSASQLLVCPIILGLTHKAWDGRTNGQTKSHLEVGDPPKNSYHCLKKLICLSLFVASLVNLALAHIFSQKSSNFPSSISKHLLKNLWNCNHTSITCLKI